MSERLIWKDEFDTFNTSPGHFFEPGTHYNSTGDQGFFQGMQCQRGWSLGKNANTNDGADAEFVHRAYSISDLSQTLPPTTIFGPVLYSLLVYIPSAFKLELLEKGTNGWGSTLTLASLNWSEQKGGRLIATGLDPYTQVMKMYHVPRFGESEHIRLNPLPWPRDKWVRQCAYIDFSSENGYVKLYQDGTQTTHSEIIGGKDEFTQEHAGFYTSATYTPVGPAGGIYNAQKRIYAVDGETDCVRLIRPLGRF